MVLDRLFLWLFTLACVMGTGGIILRAPSIYDMREPIDAKVSEITNFNVHKIPVQILHKNPQKNLKCSLILGLPKDKPYSQNDFHLNQSRKFIIEVSTSHKTVCKLVSNQLNQLIEKIGQAQNLKIPKLENHFGYIFPLFFLLIH